MHLKIGRIMKCYGPMGKWALLTYLFLAVCIVSSCDYDSEEELYPVQPSGCDTTTVSYMNDIEPLISQNCYQCHSAALNFGNVTLEGYSAFKSEVDRGRLTGAIRRDFGFSSMPQDGDKLPDCDISKVEAWINNGAPNN